MQQYLFFHERILLVQAKSKRKILLPIIFGLLAVLMAACGNTTSTPPTTNLASKQILKEPVENGDFDSLDPALTQAGLGEPFNLIYSNLVKLNDDGSIAPDLASSYQVSADGLTYTFTLRSGLKFSDGTALTANDVAYSLNRAVLPATKSTVSAYLGQLKDYDKVTAGKIPTLINDSIVVKDANTIALTITSASAVFLYSLTYSTGDVVEQKTITAYGTAWTDHLDQGAGDGPFKVKSYSHTAGLILVPNPNYFGFVPKLTEIDYIIAADRDTNFKAYQAGQYDMAPVPPASDALASTMKGFVISPALAVRFIEMNYLVKPLGNKHIRQALALALNKDLVINHVINTVTKIVTPSNHIVINGIPGYNKDLKGPAGVVSTTGDQAMAKTLFAQGLAEEGMTLATFPKLTINYIKTYAAGGTTLNAFADQWKSVLGITIKVVGEPSTQLQTDEGNTIGHAGPLQMWYGVWGADYPDPQDFLSNFFAKGGAYNQSNYGQNNSADAADQQAVQAELAKADVDTNQAERLSLYQDAEQKIVDDAGWITTYQSAYVYVISPKLHGWTLTPLGFMTVNDWANVYFTK